MRSRRAGATFEKVDETIHLVCANISINPNLLVKNANWFLCVSAQKPSLKKEWSAKKESTPIGRTQMVP